MIITLGLQAVRKTYLANLAITVKKSIAPQIRVYFYKFQTNTLKSKTEGEHFIKKFASENQKISCPNKYTHMLLGYLNKLSERMIANLKSEISLLKEQCVGKYTYLIVVVVVVRNSLIIHFQIDVPDVNLNKI